MHVMCHTPSWAERAVAEAVAGAAVADGGLIAGCLSFITVYSLRRHYAPPTSASCERRTDGRQNAVCGVTAAYAIPLPQPCPAQPCPTLLLI